MTSTVAVVRHRVADFDAWRKVYDGFAPIQAEHGVHAHQVLRSIESPNDVTVTHTFDSREAAREFFAMPELKEAMSNAGVRADSVEISYFDEVESGALVGV
jgi:quinol monooxygenase YgiN